MLVDLLPVRARLKAEIAIQLCVVAFGAPAAALRLRPDRAQLGHRGDLAADQLGVIYLPLPALALALILQGAAQTIEAARGRAAQVAPEPETTGL